MPSPDEIERFMAAAQRLMASHRHYLDIAARQLALSPTQLLALSVISRLKTVKTTALSHLLDLSTGATTALLDRMEERHLVERHRNDEDRRVVQVSLSDEGQALFERSSEQTRCQINTALCSFDTAHLAQLLQGQEDLARTWENVTAMQERIAH